MANNFVFVLFGVLMLVTNCIGNNIDLGLQTHGGPRVIPVSELSLVAFMGRWYQVYSSLIPVSTYEKDLVCIGADYTALNATAFSLTNFGRIKVPNGTRKELSGTATLLSLIHM